MKVYGTLARAVAAKTGSKLLVAERSHAIVILEYGFAKGYSGLSLEEFRESLGHASGRAALEALMTAPLPDDVAASVVRNLGESSICTDVKTPPIDSEESLHAWLTSLLCSDPNAIVQAEYVRSHTTEN